MRADAWPQYCRAALVRSVSAAAAQFPGPGEEAPERVHDVRKTLKEARAIARLFLHCVGEPARVTIAALAATRRQIGRARDLDVMALRLQRLAPPPEVAEPLMAAIAREREAALRARRGLAASAPRAQAQRDRQAPRGMGLERGRDRDEIVAAVARTYRQAQRRGRRRLRQRRAGGAARVSRPRRRSALPARAPRLRLAGSAERPGRRIGRASRGARRPSTISMCWRNSPPSAASCRRRRSRSSPPAWRRSRKSSGGAPRSSSIGCSPKRRTPSRPARRLSRAAGDEADRPARTSRARPQAAAVTPRA